MLDCWNGLFQTQENSSRSENLGSLWRYIAKRSSTWRPLGLWVLFPSWGAFKNSRSEENENRCRAEFLLGVGRAIDQRESYRSARYMKNVHTCVCRHTTAPCVKKYMRVLMVYGWEKPCFVSLEASSPSQEQTVRGEQVVPSNYNLVASC